MLPLGISTAAAGLYQKDYLNLPYPEEDKDSLDRTILIWGGSSSVGSCAIQLAKASGAEVITTASPSNFDYCKKLGASQCFDYHDDDIEDEIVDALKGKTVLGAFHAVGGDGAVESCAKIVDRAKGKAQVVSVRGIPDEGIPSSVRTKSSKLSRASQSSSWLTLCAFSLGRQHLHQRCWTVHLAQIPTQGAGYGNGRSSARARYCWRGAKICPSGFGQAEEGCEREEGRGY